VTPSKYANLDYTVIADSPLLGFIQIDEEVARNDHTKNSTYLTGQTRFQRDRLVLDWYLQINKYLKLRVHTSTIVMKFFWPFDCQNVSMERLSRQTKRGSAEGNNEGLLKLISCPNKVMCVDRKRKERARRQTKALLEMKGTCKTKLAPRASFAIGIHM
jgi:hypothetical protein